MAFYNRLLAQMVARYVDPGTGIVQPLSVYEVGGAGKVNLTVASGGNTQIVAAPTAPKLWRLHRFSSPDVVGGAAAVSLLDPNGSFLSVLTSQSPTDNLEGELVGTSLSVFNGLAGNARVTLTLDLVANTSIS